MTAHPLLPPNPLHVRTLGRVDYEETWRAMIEFTAQRDSQTPDELWVCEHPPVYTLGVAGKSEHLLADNGIPLVRVDRGGQITYHGPGQVVIYLLLDLARRRLKTQALVHLIEQAIIDFLATQKITAIRQQGAPGVYVRQTENSASAEKDERAAKIAALGLRVRKKGCYHGLSLNIAMDLSPFNAINPCGYPGLQMTQTQDCGSTLAPQDVAQRLAQKLIDFLI